MRAIIIDPVLRTVEPYTVDRRLASLQAAVGGLIAFATDLDTGDVLYVNDEGLFADQPKFFALAGAHQPFAGRGLLVGPERHGVVTDVITPIERVRKLVSFDVDVDHDQPRQVRTVIFDSAGSCLEYLRRTRRRPIKTK